MIIAWFSTFNSQFSYVIDVIGFYIYQLNAKYITKMLFDKELDSFFIICFLEKNPPSLQRLPFETGDEVRQQSRWHFLCLSADVI